MSGLTNFADQAVLLPLVCVVAAGLGVSGWWRGLGAWMLVPSVFGITAVLKYVFYTCAGPLGSIGIHNPSGHTAAGAAVYGGAVALALKGRAPPLILSAIPVGFAAVIGATRVALGAHTVADVLAGGVIGVAGAMLMLAVAGPRPPLRLLPTLCCGLLVLALTYGRRLEAEELVHRFPPFVTMPLPTACTQAPGR